MNEEQTEKINDLLRKYLVPPRAPIFHIGSIWVRGQFNKKEPIYEQSII